MSPEGLNQRFNSAAVQLLLQILIHLLAQKSNSPDILPHHYTSNFQRIRVLDSTMFQLPDLFASEYQGSGGSSHTAWHKDLTGIRFAKWPISACRCRNPGNETIGLTELPLNGRTRPISIEWDDGRVFGIDRVLDVRQAASLKAGGQGIRYVCRICGK